MQIIKYKRNGMEMIITYNEKNLEITKAEADRGEFTIEDDGIELIHTPTTDERLQAIEQFLDKLKSVFPNL